MKITACRARTIIEQKLLDSESVLKAILKTSKIYVLILLIYKAKSGAQGRNRTRACGVTVADLAVAWRKLWEAVSRAEIATAVDQYIRLTSVTLTDAVLGVLQPPPEYAKTARYDFSMAFTYRGHKRFWKADLSRLLTY